MDYAAIAEQVLSMAGAFNVHPERITGELVALIDDRSARSEFAEKMAFALWEQRNTTPFEIRRPY